MEINNRVSYTVKYDKELEKNTTIEDSVKDLKEEYKSVSKLSYNDLDQDGDGSITYNEFVNQLGSSDLSAGNVSELWNTIAKSVSVNYSSGKTKLSSLLDIIQNTTSKSSRMNKRTEFLNLMNDMNLTTANRQQALEDLRGAIQSSMAKAYDGTSDSKRQLNKEFKEYENDIDTLVKENLAYKDVQYTAKTSFDNSASDAFQAAVESISNAKTIGARSDLRNRAIEILQNSQKSANEIQTGLETIRGAIQSSMAEAYDGTKENKRALNTEFQGYESGAADIINNNSSSDNVKYTKKDSFDNNMANLIEEGRNRLFERLRRRTQN